MIALKRGLCCRKRSSRLSPFSSGIEISMIATSTSAWVRA
ncbi:Uncharacterised protein [Vibrio cholerae]|nr:Uncharacterised protein [Vibrio cholerae]